MTIDNSKKKSLGRGLSDLGLTELLGDVTAPAVNTRPTEILRETSSDKLRMLGVDELRPGRYQPRRNMAREALQELADSIRAQGIIQPIVARRIDDNGFEIIAGERRWRAAQLAGLAEVPVIVRDVPDETALAIGLIENIQRRDLNSIEEAMALQRLINEFALTHQEVADAVGKSRTVVTNLLRLLKLNTEVRAMVEMDEIEMGHARALLALEEAQQLEVARKIVARNLSVRETEMLIRNFLNSDKSSEAEEKSYIEDPNVKRLQRALSEKLGATVAIQHQTSGKGKLVIQYTNLDELDGILDKIMDEAKQHL